MRHLSVGSKFYEQQAPGLGTYFRDCLVEEIEKLHVSAGTHQIVPEGFYRSISRRFPFAIYYLFEGDKVIVSAILDSRRDPEWIRKQLK